MTPIYFFRLLIYSLIHTFNSLFTYLRVHLVTIAKLASVFCSVAGDVCVYELLSVFKIKSEKKNSQLKKNGIK